MGFASFVMNHPVTAHSLVGGGLGAVSGGISGYTRPLTKKDQKKPSSDQRSARLKAALRGGLGGGVFGTALGFSSGVNEANSRRYQQHYRRYYQGGGSGKAQGTGPVKGFDEALKHLNLSGKEKTKAEVKKMYWRMAREHHPDKGGDAEKFKHIGNSWEHIQKSRWFEKLAADFSSGLRAIAHF